MVIIDLSTNKMAHIDKYGKHLEWDLNEEDFPKWIDLTKMKIKSSNGNVICYE